IQHEGERQLGAAHGDRLRNSVVQQARYLFAFDGPGLREIAVDRLPGAFAEVTPGEGDTQAAQVRDDVHDDVTRGPALARRLGGPSIDGCRRDAAVEQGQGAQEVVTGPLVECHDRTIRRAVPWPATRCRQRGKLRACARFPRSSASTTTWW